MGDFKVARQYASDIADFAATWRAGESSTTASHSFDIVRFLTDTVLPSLAKAGRVVSLEIVNDDIELDKAWVDFVANKLCIQRYIWEAAKRQKPLGRLVLAHEIGHLVLHRDQLFAFSRSLEVKLNFLEPEDSAECQANWFAWALLLPDQVLLRLAQRMSVPSIATLAIVDEKVVRLRLNLLQRDKRYRIAYDGDPCPQCDGFRVVRIATTLICSDCGQSASE